MIAVIAMIATMMVDVDYRAQEEQDSGSTRSRRRAPMNKEREQITLQEEAGRTVLSIGTGRDTTPASHKHIDPHVGPVTVSSRKNFSFLPYVHGMPGHTGI